MEFSVDDHAQTESPTQVEEEHVLFVVVAVLVLAMLFSAIVVLVVRKIVDPLKKLTDAAKKLSNGNYDVEIVHSNTYEIKLLSTAFENMTMHLREHEKHQRLLAYRDSMTGLRNTTAYKAWVTDFDKEIQRKQMAFGVIVLDVNDLKGQITKLQGDLKAKDDEYAAKEADRVFDDALSEAIKTAGGKNAKSVKALLDIKALKESKNQSDDIKKALEDIKKTDAYLFGSNEPYNNAVGGTGGAGGEGDNLAAMRAAMGLPAEKK